MTIKQCNSCKYYHINIKTKNDGCFYVCKTFMKSKNCGFYEQGNFREVQKEWLEKGMKINRYLKGV